MRRDPLAELYLERSRGRSSSTLLAPVVHPLTGQTFWLSLGQYLTYAWIRRRMRHERGETTLARIGLDVGSSPGRISHRLDRLASLGLIARHSTRGRLGRTRFWPPRRKRLAGVVANDSASTPFGGYLTREGLGRSLRRGARRRHPPEPPGGGRPRRGQPGPPRLLWERCPLDGGAVRLSRWEARLETWRHQGTPRRLRGLWGGTCRRCGGLVVTPVDVRIPRPAAEHGLAPVGSVLRTLIRPSADQAPAAPESAEPPVPDEHRRSLAIEAIAELDDRDQAEELRARYAPDLPSLLEPEPSSTRIPVLVAADPGDRRELGTLVDRWRAGELDLDRLEAAGYGPGRAWWDLSRARRARPSGGER